MRVTPLMRQTRHHLKNSKDLTEKLKTRVVPPGNCLVSHDVVSLFTNVPIQEALDVIKDRLERDNTRKDRTNLDVDDIMMLLKFVCKSKYMSNVLAQQ